MTNKNLLNTLPNDIIEGVKSTLKAYDKCNVIYQNGKYNVRVGYSLTKEYAEDFKFIGEFVKEEVFSENEIIENYINEFNCYPANYKGAKSYTLVNKMREEKEFDWDNNTVTRWVGKINELGDFVLTEKVTFNI